MVSKIGFIKSVRIEASSTSIEIVYSYRLVKRLTPHFLYKMTLLES